MKLEAKNLSFRYDNGNRKILNNVSLCLESGDRLGLTAPSGFGKTTCCKILAGYEQPDSGQVLVDGRPLSSYKGYCPVRDDLAASGIVRKSKAENAGGAQGRYAYRSADHRRAGD